MMQKLKNFFSKLKPKWLDLYNKVWPVLAPFLKNKVTMLILNFLKISGGGIWGWLLTFILSPLLNKLGQWLESNARLEDQENIDEENINKLKEDKQNGVPLETIIKDEEDLLNGRPIKRP